METLVSLSEVQATLNSIGLNSVDADTRSECPLLIVEDIFSLGLPVEDDPEFDNFTLCADPDADYDMPSIYDEFEKGDMYFLLCKVYNHLFTQVGWNVEDLTSGNGICPLFNIEKAYPFEEDVRYVVACPNSVNDDISNEECNAFEVWVAPKGEEDGDFDWSEGKNFKTIQEVIEFIYGEE